MPFYYHALVAYAGGRKSPHWPWLIAGGVWADLHYLPAMAWFKLLGQSSIPEAFMLPWTMAVTAVTHSLVVWLAAFFLLRGAEVGRAFAYGWLTHLVTDFLTHRAFLPPPLLWPLVRERIPGPVDWVDPAISQFLLIAAVMLVVALILERMQLNREQLR